MFIGFIKNKKRLCQIYIYNGKVYLEFHLQTIKITIKIKTNEIKINTEKLWAGCLSNYNSGGQSNRKSHLKILIRIIN